MDYTGTHAEALAKVKEKGVPVVFTNVTPGTYDPLNDTTSEPIVDNVEGWGVEVPADPQEYAAMELIVGESIVIFFVPNEIGDGPRISSSVQWAGAKRTVQKILPIRPDGTFIAARVVVS